MGLLPAASVTMARLVFLRLPKPARVRLRLPCRLRVFTDATSTLKIFSIAILIDRKSTRLNSSHDQISYAVFCLKKKKKNKTIKINDRTDQEVRRSSPES